MTGVQTCALPISFRQRQLAGRRFLHLRPDGFAVRTGMLGRAHDLRWADVAAVEPAGPTDVLLRRSDGRSHRVSFAPLHEGPAHCARLLAHAQAHGASAAPAA